jgi:diguanylate cyclase (GGDEF)-like protein/PAS domain S-box-containing protein
MTMVTPDDKDALYRAVFNHTAVPMLILDLATKRVLEANPAAGTAYGYAPDEWSSISFLDLWAPEARSRIQARLSRDARASVIELEIARHRRRDGREIWAEASLCRLNVPELYCAVLSVTEISDEQMLARDLRAVREPWMSDQSSPGLGHCVVDLKNGRHYWSWQQYKNFGLEVGSIPGSVKALVRCLRPEDRAPARSAIHACMREGISFEADWRLVWPDATEHIVHAQGIRIEGNDNLPSKFICTTADVSEKRRIEANLEQVRNVLKRSQQIAQIGTWTLDLETLLADPSSGETLKMFGFEKGPVSLEEIDDRIHPEDLPAVHTARRLCLANPGAGYYVQYRVVPRPGELRYVESQAEAQTDASGKAIRMAGYVRDITAAKRAEQEIQRLAYHDEITSLPNRNALRKTLDLEIGTETHACALMVIDIPHFQDVLLTLGHNNADCLLKDVAARICVALGERVYVAHTGNFQFTAILGKNLNHDFKRFAGLVKNAFEKPFSAAGINYDLDVHIGVALSPEHSSDAIALMRMANVAVFQAKEAGADLLLYRHRTDPYKPERLALLGEFRSAIHDQQLKLYCQPKVDMKTGEVTGAESLVRWKHPERGMIQPSHFVPLIERTNLIHVLTLHMLQASFEQCSGWEKEGLHLPLAVNLSTRNLLSPELVPNLETLLHTWGGKSDWLGLEITEGSLIANPDASIAELDTLSRMGFRMFIDDFGTGYSSLSYLMKMPVNVIKVDQGFTMNMLRDKGAAAIVKSTIELAHNLGMSVVAEGVSSKEIWDELVEYGCDEAQGFYVSEPFPAAQFPDWIRTTGRRVACADGGAHRASYS